MCCCCCCVSVVVVFVVQLVVVWDGVVGVSNGDCDDNDVFDNDDSFS